MERIEFSYGDLHPAMRDRFQSLTGWLIERKLPFRPFEGYRSPERQDFLLIEGTTKAKRWQSPHQYGLAVDYVALHGQEWSWNDNEPWDALRTGAKIHGLDAPIPWDRAHVRSPLWEQIRKARR